MACSIYSGPGCVAPTIQHHGSEQQAGRLRSHTNTLIFVWKRNSAKSMGVSKVHSSQLMNLQGSPVLPAGLPAGFWAVGQPLPNIRFGPQISSSRQNLATKQGSDPRCRHQDRCACGNRCVVVGSCGVIHVCRPALVRARALRAIRDMPLRR